MECPEGTENDGRQVLHQAVTGGYRQGKLPQNDISVPH